jgi:hypothetical protein
VEGTGGAPDYYLFYRHTKHTISVFTHYKKKKIIKNNIIWGNVI